MKFTSVFDKNDKWNNVLYIIIGMFFLPGLIKIFYLLIALNKWSFIPLLLGILYKGRRLYGSWRPLLENLFIGMGVGFYIFLLIHSNGGLDKNIEFVVFVFLFSFIVAFLIKFNKYRKEIIPRLSEGVTLLHSLAVIYWFVDYEKFTQLSILTIIIFIVIFGFSLLSIANAFTKIPLSNTNRFLLSIWSSVVIILFSIDYIINVYRNNEISADTSFLYGVYIFMIYFMLGITAIYIAQNIFMIIGFLPDKGESSAKYSQRRKALKRDHIERYSDAQVSGWYSLFCVIYSSTLFWLNYTFQFVNKQFIIWVVFISFPIVIHFFELLKNKRNERSDIKIFSGSNGIEANSQ